MDDHSNKNSHDQIEESKQSEQTPPVEKNSTDLPGKRGKIKKILSFLFPLLTALAFGVYLIKTRPVTPQLKKKFFVPKVRTLKVYPVVIQKRTIGYGRAEAVRTWKGFSEVRGKILTLGFSLIQPDSFLTFAPLVESLKKRDTPLAKYLSEGLSSSSKKLLQKYNGPSISPLLKSVLIYDLNQILNRASLFSPSRFEKISLSGEIQTLLREKHQGPNLFYLNRKLLEVAYPTVFKKLHPYSIEEGQFLPQGAVICQIDPREYYLLMEQRRMSIEKNTLQIRELQQEAKNLKDTLTIEVQRAVLLEQEYLRRKKEMQNNAASPSQVERELNTYLLQKNNIGKIKNSLKLIPLKIKNLETSVRIAISQLEQARLDLAKTVIRAPFHLRITKKNIALNQPVSPGQILVEAIGIESVNVVGQFQMKDLRNQIFPADYPFDFSKFLHRGFSQYLSKVQLRALVYLSVARDKKQLLWNGVMTGVRPSVDPTSQTVPLVIKVSRPYKNMVPGIRPPLVPGMYCKVVLLGPKQSDVFCIPRSAYRQGLVYLLNDGKLKLQKVEVDFFQEGYVILRKGLQKGDVVILSPLFPALPNMALVGLDESRQFYQKIKKTYPWFISLKEGKKK